jgi:4-hydroxybenzoate polyprenyltransferase/phosphoserine phosphatase
MDRDLQRVLVVDLDGTLIRSDILIESFWSALGRDWRSPFRSIVALLSGRAALKQYLAQTATLDAAMLPFDATVVDYVKAWRKRGGKTALVTASDQTIAKRVADHLGLFDEVYGSDGRVNLKGAAKADFLSDHFGVDGYAYMGDATADLPVWQHAQKAITVNAAQTLRSRVEKIATNVEHLTTGSQTIGPYLASMRPHQWFKNVLVFLPMLVAHELNWHTLLPSFVAFIAFCLVASSVYVMNDLLDLPADRAHPRKRFRPFASGRVPITHGSWMALGLLVLGLMVAAPLGWTSVFVMVVYYAVSTAYSLFLKRRIVIDICILAGLYTLRIVAGGVATGIELSVWLLAFSIFFFFSLAAVKRQAELVDNAERGQINPAGRGYQISDLPIVSTIALGAGYVSVLVMALYVNSPAVQHLYPRPYAFWGICCVLLYWVTYVVMVTHRGGMHDDPVVFAAKDRNSRICVLIVVAFAILGAAL